MAPVVVVPVVVMPMAMMPVMAMIMHLQGLHLVDFVLRYDCRLHVCHSRHSQRVARDRRYGCSLCAHSQQDRARNQTSTEFQEIPKFHHLMPLS
jgi:hypothetical protein